jgi:hypothetical protein
MYLRVDAETLGAAQAEIELMELEALDELAHGLRFESGQGRRPLPDPTLTVDSKATVAASPVRGHDG